MQSTGFYISIDFSLNIAATTMIVSSVLPAYRLESFPIFNRAPVIRDKLPLRNAEYKARMIAAKMSKKLTSAPNTEQAWDFSLTYIFSPLEIFFTQSEINNVDSPVYTFVWNLAIAINYILPWAAKIEQMVAVEKRQIYSDVFGPFMMKGDGWHQRDSFRMLFC